MNKAERVHVAVAVISRWSGAQREFLLSKRPVHLHQGGLWEFPGGKVELGEDLQQALARELYEELAICNALADEPLIRIRHDYTDKQVLLDVWMVNHFEGEPYGREGQEVRWVSDTELDSYNFPEANLPILNALRFPRRYLITPDFQDYTQLKHYALRAVELGFRFLQIRQHHLDAAEYGQWIDQMTIDLKQTKGVKIFLNRPLDELCELDEHRVYAWHLSSTAGKQAKAQQARLPDLFGLSCHSPEEIALAGQLGAAYALLSPVRKTQSHPLTNSMGFERFSELVELASFPVYALGGLDQSHMEQAIRCGAQGIAAIRAWQQMIEQEESVGDR